MKIQPAIFTLPIARFVAAASAMRQAGQPATQPAGKQEAKPATPAKIDVERRPFGKTDMKVVDTCGC